MLWFRFARAALLLCALCLAAGPAEAKKLALLIGNADYAHTGRLRSPVNDAAAMARRLETLGYEVTRLSDADRRTMGRALKRFGREARGADTALVYYSGHGMELGGRNYLAPIDAELAHPDDAGIEAIALDDVIAAAAGAERLSVVILDACRNNSFPSATKSGPKGFRAIGARPGQVIAFATAPGQVALDGGAELSPYTRALTDALDRAPEVDVRRLFTSLGAATRKYAGAEQTPFTRFGDMPLEDVALADGPAAAPDPEPTAPPPQAPQRDAAPSTERDWLIGEWDATGCAVWSPFQRFTRALGEITLLSSTKSFAAATRSYGFPLFDATSETWKTKDNVIVQRTGATLRVTSQAGNVCEWRRPDPSSGPIGENWLIGDWDAGGCEVWNRFQQVKRVDGALQSWSSAKSFAEASFSYDIPYFDAAELTWRTKDNVRWTRKDADVEVISQGGNVCVWRRK